MLPVPWSASWRSFARSTAWPSDKDTYPDIALSDLADERFDAFFAIMDDVVKQVRRANL